MSESQKQNNLTKISSKSAKRLGRGLGSGRGKTAGRGTKGQKSRSGFNIPRRFEGGQTSWIQRLPKKKGFRGRSVPFNVVHLSLIEKKFKTGGKINKESLFKAGIIKDKSTPVKILADKKPEVKFNFREVKVSQKILKFQPEKKSSPKTKKE